MEATKKKKKKKKKKWKESVDEKLVGHNRAGRSQAATPNVNPVAIGWPMGCRPECDRWGRRDNALPEITKASQSQSQSQLKKRKPLAALAGLNGNQTGRPFSFLFFSFFCVCVCVCV